MTRLKDLDLEQLKASLYDSIFEFIKDEHGEDEAKLETHKFVDDTVLHLEDLDTMTEETEPDISSVMRKFHTLKNLFLYADLYYESDLAADIEDEIRNEIKITERAKKLYDELYESLKQL